MQRDSSYFKDFVGGVDPTGISTFKAGRNNKQNHGKHKLVSTVGGVAGGAGLSVLGAGFGAKALGAVVGLKNKSLGKMISGSGGDILRLFNPKKAFNTMKNLGKASTITSGRMKMADNVFKLKKQFGSGIVGKVKSVAKTPGVIKNTVKDAGKLDKMEKSLVKSTGGISATDTYTSGLGMSAGLASAGIGGAISGFTAYKQYGAGAKLGNRSNQRPKAYRPSYSRSYNQPISSYKPSYSSNIAARPSY